MFPRPILSLTFTLLLATGLVASAAPKKILFFTKSSGFEHSVISWTNGQPSYAEKVLLELGAKHGWEFTFSKDGSKFSPGYLAQFDTVMFYTTGNLLTPGTDGHPAMTPEGKQALFDYVRGGRGFVGTHSASDTFHTANEDRKGPDRYVNHGAEADAYVRFLGGEFIKHGAQQPAKSTVIDPAFPGFEKVPREFSLHEEWYSLKDFSPDIHVLTMMDAPSMTGVEYQRPPFPNTWARQEGKGRVWYTSMGHREDIWTNDLFQNIRVGGVKWALGEVAAAVPPNLASAAPGALTNPPYVAPQPPKPVAATGLGVKPPAGADLLIDGTRETLDAKWIYWKGPRFASAMPIKWKIVEDPVDQGTVLMTDDPAAAGGKFGAADIVTKKPYRDFRLHIEFLVTKPGGNSGVYLQNRYEIQIKDGDPTKHGMGAVINETESPYHAYHGIGKWNAYDLVFRAARFKDSKLTEKAQVTMYFNGRKVHTNQQIQKVWGGANSGIDGGNSNGSGITDTPQGLKLQCEGHDVRYRNAWIQELDLREAKTDF